MNEPKPIKRLRKFLRGHKYYLAIAMILAAVILTMFLSAKSLDKTIDNLSLHSMTQAVEASEVEPLTVMDQIKVVADREGFSDTAYLHDLASCESGLNPSANGDGGNSYGLWQWHSPSHPTMEISCMLDIDCSTTRTIEYLKNGKSHLWTCARDIVGLY